MKITKETLKDMIAEEMEASLHEKATPVPGGLKRIKRDPLSQAMGDALKANLEAPRKGAKAVLDYAADKLPLPTGAGRPDPFGIEDEDEEKDFQRARELERATDAGKAITPKQKAAATAARDLPRRSMAQKSQDPALRARRRAIERDRAQYPRDGRAVRASIMNSPAIRDPGPGRGDRPRDQTEPEPQQSRIRESFNQKGKTKMKLTKDSLKELIKEELDVVTESANARQTQAMGRGIQLAIDELQRGQKILSNPDVVKRGLSSIHGQKVLARLKAAISRIESATFDLEQAAGVSAQDPGTKYDRFPGASLVPDDMDLEVR